MLNLKDVFALFFSGGDFCSCLLSEFTKEGILPEMTFNLFHITT